MYKMETIGPVGKDEQSRRRRRRQVGARLRHDNIGRRPVYGEANQEPRHQRSDMARDKWKVRLSNRTSGSGGRA